MMPAGHHSDSDSTLLPLPKSTITWFGGIFARLSPLAAGLLGLTISDNLEWKTHVQKIANQEQLEY